MSRTADLEKSIKIVGTWLYRIGLLSYGIVIIIFNSNAFHIAWYISAALVFSLLTTLLRRESEKSQQVMIFADFALIYLILYGKQITFNHSIFLVLPICNLPNLIRKRWHYLLVLMLTGICFCLLNMRIVYSIAIPMTALGLISLFEYYRNKAFSFVHNLNSTVFDLYDAYAKEKTDVPSRMYQTVLDCFNNSRFSSLFMTQKIFYLDLHKDGTYDILNSSSFNIVFSIKLEPGELQKIAVEKEVVSGVSIVTDGGEIGDCYLIPVPRGSATGIFILSVVSKPHPLNRLSGIRDWLLKPSFLPFFGQLAIFMDAQIAHKKDGAAKFESIKGDYEYVLKAISAVHYIRNRLTPFNNYLEMIADVDREKDPVIKAKLQQVLKEETNRSRKSFKEIDTRSNQVLNDDDNPFNVCHDVVEMRVNELFEELRSLTADMRNSGGILSAMELPQYEKKVTVSKKGIIVVFSDLVNNIRKHKAGEFRITFSHMADELHIAFWNKTADGKIARLREMVSYFESDDKAHIFTSKTKGQFMMKDFLKQMGIKATVVYVEKENSFCFTIILKTTL
ncbi:MAG: hypothetical protein V4539_11640 [Bacteroidota bacterium]